jgi:hypothetical protein
MNLSDVLYSILNTVCDWSTSYFEDENKEVRYLAQDGFGPNIKEQLNYCVINENSGP